MGEKDAADFGANQLGRRVIFINVIERCLPFVVLAVGICAGFEERFDDVRSCIRFILILSLNSVAR